MRLGVVFLMGLLVGGYVYAQANINSISVKNGSLAISAYQNTYALLAREFGALGEGPGEITVQVKVKTNSAGGTTWGPGIFLYWDPGVWAGLRLVGDGRAMWEVPGKKWGYSSERVNVNEWAYLRIVLGENDVKGYLSRDGVTWSLAGEASRPAQGPPRFLMIGKGHDTGKPPYQNPMLCNSYKDRGSFTTVYMDDLQVSVGGEVRFTCDFNDGKIDSTVWKVFLDGVGSLELTAASPAVNIGRDALGGGKSQGLKEDVGVASYDFSLWERYRGTVKHPASLYKANEISEARERLLSLPLMRFVIPQLEAAVAPVMNYDRARIEHMIPELTPGCSLFTPCPVCNAGFPHGIWNWSPDDPDRIRCARCGTVFPNEKYPENLVLIARYGGKEQRFTYYGGEYWTYVNGFHIRSSFTGNIRARKVTYMASTARKLGLLYQLTGKTEYAQKAREILLRFSEVYPNYLVHSGYGEYADLAPVEAAKNITNLPDEELTLAPNMPDHVLFAGYWMAGRADAHGMEGSFLLDVALAYDLIADALIEGGKPLFTEEEKVKIEKDLLIEGTYLLTSDSAINNKTASARTAVAAVGAIVGDPGLVRFGLEGFRAFVNGWFLPDGATPESPAYALMTLESVWKLGEILNGYSDPPGYSAPDGRLDNLNLYQESKYRSVWWAMYASLLPNLRYPAIADSYPTSALPGEFVLLMALRYDNPQYRALFRETSPGLSLETLPYQLAVQSRDFGSDEGLRLPDVFFPAWKLGFLRTGEDGRDSTLILSASEYGGHHHLDSLNLFYFKDGIELLSDLGYLWDSPDKPMTTRTVAHNLVVVDQRDQRTQGRGGSLDLWAVTPRVKAIEASSSAYGDAAQGNLYRRMAAIIDHGPDNSYVVDIFRVRGGKVHDYVFHGPGNDYAIDTSLKLVSVPDETLPPYTLGSGKAAESSSPWSITWERLGNLAKGHFLALAVPEGNETVYIAQGWGQRGRDDIGAKLPYVIRRKDASGEGNTFVTVFEGYTNGPLVKAAQTLEFEPLEGGGTSTFAGLPESLSAREVSRGGMPVALEVDASGHRDYIVSSMSPVALEIPLDGAQSMAFEGVFGVYSERVSLQEAPSKGAGTSTSTDFDFLMLQGGRRLVKGGYGVELLEKPLAGKILQKEEIDGGSGFAIDAPIGNPELLVGNYVLVRKGEITTGYPIRGVKISGGKAILLTEDREGGFAFMGGEEWYIPNEAHLERISPGEFILKATGAVRVSLPAALVGKDAVLDIYRGDEKVGESAGRVTKDSVRFDISGALIGSEGVRLRIRS